MRLTRRQVKAAQHTTDRNAKHKRLRARTVAIKKQQADAKARKAKKAS